MMVHRRNLSRNLFNYTIEGKKLTRSIGEAVKLMGRVVRLRGNRRHRINEPVPLGSGRRLIEREEPSNGPRRNEKDNGESGA